MFLPLTVTIKVLSILIFIGHYLLERQKKKHYSRQRNVPNRTHRQTWRSRKIGHDWKLKKWQETKGGEVRNTRLVWQENRLHSRNRGSSLRLPAWHCLIWLSLDFWVLHFQFLSFISLSFFFFFLLSFNYGPLIRFQCCPCSSQQGCSLLSHINSTARPCIFRTCLWSTSTVLSLAWIQTLLEVHV